MTGNEPNTSGAAGRSSRHESAEGSADAANGEKRTNNVAFIGCWVRELAEQCLVAAGSSWTCVTLDEWRFKDVGNPLIRKLLRSLEYLRAIWRMRKVDVLVIVFVDNRSRNWLRIAHMLGKKCALYWIGTDVMNLTDGTLSPRGLDEADLHLVCSGENAQELGKFGFDSKQVLVPARLDNRLAEMPETHEVLLSIPDERREFYGYSDLMRLVDDFPQLTFHVVRSNRPDLYEKPNIVFEGMLDRDGMDRLYDRVSVTVRWPIHDSISLILMESALKGKHIISRNPFPVGAVVSSYGALVRALRDVISEPPAPCMEARQYALEHFIQRGAGERLGHLLDAVIDL